MRDSVVPVETALRLFRRGDSVRMTEAAKAAWRARGDAKHVDEFGSCVGTIEGPMFPDQPDAPEVDVRWQPIGLRYGYDPSELEAAPWVDGLISAYGPRARGHFYKCVRGAYRTARRAHKAERRMCRLARAGL